MLVQTHFLLKAQWSSGASEKADFRQYNQSEPRYFPPLMSSNNTRYISALSDKWKWNVWWILWLFLGRTQSAASALRPLVGHISTLFPTAPHTPNTSSYLHRPKTLSHYIAWPWRYLETIYGRVLSKYSHKSGGVTLQRGYMYSIKALLACWLFTARRFTAYFTVHPSHNK